MRAALIQMRCEKGDLTANLEQMLDHVQRAKAAGVDLVCFPEMSLTGYIDPRKQSGATLDWTAPEIEKLQRASNELDIALAVGMAETKVNSGGPFISQGLIVDGKVVAVYRKINLAEDERSRFTPGTAPTLVSYAGLRLGLAICADIDHEDLFEAYADRGVDVVIVCAAPGLHGPMDGRDWRVGYEWWGNKCRTQLGAYASTYGLQILVATQAGRTIDEDFPGGGYVFDASGQVVCDTTDWSESVLIADIEGTTNSIGV